MTTYDYNTQEWKTGQRAERLRAEQLREELELIEGPRGQEYLAFTGSTESPGAVASRIRAEMRLCRRQQLVGKFQRRDNENSTWFSE